MPRARRIDDQGALFAQRDDDIAGAQAQQLPRQAEGRAGVVRRQPEQDARLAGVGRQNVDIAQTLLLEMPGRRRIQDRERAARLADSHRRQRRLQRNLQLSHQDIALADLLGARLNVAGAHQQVGAKIDRDPVLARWQDIDEADAAAGAGDLMDEVCRDALAPIQRQRILGEGVVAQADQQADVRAKPRRANRLIAALAARSHIKRIADQALAERGPARDADRQTGVVTADHEDFAHEAPLQSARDAVCQQSPPACVSVDTRALDGAAADCLHSNPREGMLAAERIFFWRGKVEENGEYKRGTRRTRRRHASRRARILAARGRCRPAQPLAELAAQAAGRRLVAERVPVSLQHHHHDCGPS